MVPTSNSIQLTDNQTARILVVEDERIVAMNLQSKLENLGYTISGLVASGERALQIAEEKRPDLILMDIHLEGEMDGIDAARLIHDRFRIPIVYLTAYSTHEIVQRAKITQPYGYILKPCEDRELKIVIEMAIYRHQMERQLLEKERLLSATIKSIGDAVVATNPDGQITLMNPEAERLTEWNHQQATGKAIEDVVVMVEEKTGQPIESPLRKALDQRSIMTLEKESLLIAKDGSNIPIDDSAAPIQDDHGNLMGGVLVFRDITSQKEAMKAIAQLAAIVSSSEDAIFSQSLVGRITSWNSGAEKLFGYSSQEIIGQHIHLLTPPDLLEEVNLGIAQVSQGEPIHAHETTRKTKNGRILPVLVSISPIHDEMNRIVGSAVIMRDLTEFHRLEDQLRQAQKMEAIGRLAGGVAHDFNNLLTVINGYTNLVLSTLHPHDHHRESLEQIARAGDRAAELTRQLLAYGRKQLMQLKVINLNDVCRGIEKMLRRIIGEDIELQMIFEENLYPVKVDPNQLEQVIINLAANARDAMRSGGKLTIQTTTVQLEETMMGIQTEVRSGVYTTLIFRDTGCGMDAETLRHLFEPFFTTKDVGKGTGLGLATVYGIVKQSGGHIDVETRIGEGSTFRVLLPGVGEDSSAPSSFDNRDLPSGTETILLVEDEPNVRKLTQKILKQRGYTVLEASTGEEAMEFAKTWAGVIHLLLTDVVMPRMSGPKVYQLVRGIRPMIKVLFQSGYTEKGISDLGFEELKDHFIQKPFSVTDLARKVREILDQG
jgi:two-component system, cell cycle sensor histidine kinase and response regulator CckA